MTARYEAKLYLSITGYLIAGTSEEAVKEFFKELEQVIITGGQHQLPASIEIYGADLEASETTEL